MTWRALTLGEICDAGGGEVKTGPFGSQLHEADYSDVGTPVVMPKDIIEGRVSERSVARVSADHVARLAQHQLIPGDIVYGRRGDIGRQALITERERGWLCGTGCLRVTLGTSVLDPTYLHYYLRESAVIEGIAQQAIGATMPNLNTAILRGIRVRFPPRGQQRRIASILSAYDDLIENNTRRIAILEEMARRIYEEWFVRFRFPGHEGVRMVESELGLVPEGWSTTQLGRLLTVEKGLSYKGDGLTGTGAPMVNLKNILPGGGFRRDGTKPYSGAYKPRHVVRPGDIVLANTDLTQAGTVVASPAIVPNLGARECIFSHHIYAIRLNANVVPYRSYIYWLMAHDSFKAFAKGHAVGTTVLGLPKEGVTNFPFARPPENLMVPFCSLVTPMHELAETLHAKNDNLRTTRDLLLPKLISGALDVAAMPETEPLVA